MSMSQVYPGCIAIGDPNMGLYMEIGRSAFDGVYTDAANRPVRTALTEISVGFAQVYDTYSPATDATMTEYGLFVDVAVSDGTFSVHRSSQGAISGLPFNYIVIGRLYSIS